MEIPGSEDKSQRNTTLRDSRPGIKLLLITGHRKERMVVKRKYDHFVNINGSFQVSPPRIV